MTVVNGKALLLATPIKNMLARKDQHNGVSHGLSEAGYDIRLKQNIYYRPRTWFRKPIIKVFDGDYQDDWHGPSLYNTTKTEVKGRFTLASAVEEFQMPDDLVGVVHDKSTWARQSLSVFNTVIEPGWKGFLTLELVFHGEEEVTLLHGSGIAQVLFHRLERPAEYAGKYQNQEDEPVRSRFV